ncbi:hypothetical protein X801_02667 [Opisthorchis viverrini]|uniref:Ion transport N-terminal domain-containing protein n=1 Tax=Opisthorchis viverrini TaxID=6198 RepID=A0A1S8X3Y5_OPIVI|nr:hypothetical protein X801_02667 [Opisthorchis viverrini]
MKLFGNKVALACERRRQREQGKWVIHPCSNFRTQATSKRNFGGLCDLGKKTNTLQDKNHYP